MMKVGTTNKYVREMWLKNTLRKIPPNSRILDAGAGELQYKHLCSHLNYVSQDFAGYDGKGNGAGLQTGEWAQKNLDILSDITKIPESDESFDAIMCIEVFEHLQEPVRAIEEFARLLKPAGHLIITAPFCSLTHFAPYHFYTGFSKYFYATFLSKYNFKIIDLQPNGNFSEYIAQEMRRIPFILKKYTSLSEVPFLDRIAIKWALRALERYSKIDKGSSELLNFGYHVYAIKK